MGGAGPQGATRYGVPFSLRPAARPAPPPPPLDAVLWRAAHDLAFRRRLLAAPHAALAEEGVRVPVAVRVRCVERGDDADALIVLPDYAGEADPALPDDALDVVCGGAVVGAIWPPARFPFLPPVREP